MTLRDKIEKSGMVFYFSLVLTVYASGVGTMVFIDDQAEKIRDDIMHEIDCKSV
ncbi:MAG: hypothetical protein AB8B87_05350 [Granulosicoccus sp.]